MNCADAVDGRSRLPSRHRAAHDFLIRIVVSNCFSYMFTGWFLLLLSWKTAGKVTKNNLNPLSGPVLFPMKVFHVPPSCPRSAGNAGRGQAVPKCRECGSQTVGNAVPRQSGMGFPDGREFAVQCKSDGVRGIVSHRGTESTEAGRVGRQGGRESGASPMQREIRSTGRSGGDAESCLKILSIHLTEDPDLQDAGRVHR